MTTPDPAQAAADRVDRLLAELHASPDPRAAAVADELACCLVQLYGAGLARIAAMLGPHAMTGLCADPLVESLLLVHDLHPVSVDERIRQALERARPGELVDAGIDEAGVAHLRLATAATGCPSSRQAMLREIEDLVRQAAPEVTDVDVQVPPPAPPLLQVGLRPGIGRPAAPLVPVGAGP